MRKGRVRAFYLSTEAQEILDKWGGNVSEFVDRSILAAQGLRRNKLISEIKRKTGEAMGLEAELSVVRAEMTSLQTQLSILDKQDDVSKAKQERAIERLKKARNERDEQGFYGFLTGPAGIKLLEEAGFETPNDCVDFLNAEVGK